MDEILFAVLRDDAVIPKKRDEDAGYDIYACFDEPWRIIEPNHTEFIPTGIISAFPKEYVAILKERGSTGSIGIGQRAGVIDSGFRGEWMVALSNHNSRPIAITKKGYENDSRLDGCIIYSYEKAICQSVFLLLASAQTREVSPQEIFAVHSMRGFGKLGSSGK